MESKQKSLLLGPLLVTPELRLNRCVCGDGGGGVCVEGGLNFLLSVC